MKRLVAVLLSLLLAAPPAFAGPAGSVTGGSAGDQSELVGGVYLATPPALTNGQQAAFQFDSSGNLKISGGGTGGTASSFGSAFPITGTAVGFKDSTGALMAPGVLDASGFLKVNVAAGSSGNGASSNTGSAVPIQAGYTGINIGGTLRGLTGANPTGSVFALHSDLTSFGGTSVSLGAKTSAASLPVVLASDQAALPVTGTFWQATQPVSGTVAATQSGTWTVQPGNVANTTAWKVDGSAVTQPVSVATLPALATGANVIGAVTQSGTWNVNNISGTVSLPTGAATAAAQTAVTGSSTGGSAAASSTLVGGVYNTAAPTLTNGQQAAAQFDANGNLKIAIASGGGSGGTASSFGSAFPATGTAAGFLNSAGTNMAAANLDASGNLLVNVAAGSGSNPAAGATGSAVPASADYGGVNIGGTMRGRTGVNPSGSVYAAQTDITSVNGATVVTGHGTATGALRVELPTDGTGTVGLAAGSATIGALTANQSVNNAQVNGVTIAAGNGTTNTGTQRVTLSSDSTGQVALAAGSATIGALTANQTVNVAQLNGVAPTMGNGIAGTGVQRVTIASDSTGVVGLAAGSAVIGHVITDTGSTTAVTGTVATNIAQMNGVTTTMGNGVSGTGVQRVTLASDSTGQVALAAGSATIGALTANQSVNIAQMNGVATTMGNGVAGTGVQRVVIASDNTVLPAVGAGATGAAVPANASYLGTSQSQVLKGVTGCDQHAFYDASDNGKKTVVSGTASKKTYVCGYILATGGTATNLSLTSGTGADCVTTSTAITPAYQLVANDRVGANAPFWNGLITLANADNLCVNASAGNAHQVEIWYTQQ